MNLIKKNLRISMINYYFVLNITHQAVRCLQSLQKNIISIAGQNNHSEHLT